MAEEAPGPTHVQHLAAFAVDCRKGMPAEVTADVGGRVLDVLGNCLAGLAESGGPDEPDQAMLRTVVEWGGARQASVVGYSELLPAAERGVG